MDKNIKELSGANMDIDLTSDKSDIQWEQSTFDIKVKMFFEVFRRNRH